VKRIAFTFAVSAMLATAAAYAAGTVQVNFVKPDTFTDARDRAYSREQNLEALKQVFIDVAAPYVAVGQTLELDILDVDLAGGPRPGSVSDMRVLRGQADWPRIKLIWKLVGGPQPLSGQATVQDMNYLNRLPPALATSRLIHERRMLEAWFREEFGKASRG
jgi:hypothetical protein